MHYFKNLSRLIPDYHYDLEKNKISNKISTNHACGVNGYQRLVDTLSALKAIEYKMKSCFNDFMYEDACIFKNIITIAPVKTFTFSFPSLTVSKKIKKQLTGEEFFDAL